MSDKPQVVFFGTGPVAAKSLQLLSKWADIEAVVTKPKPPHHKGDFPVAETALDLGLDIIEVSSKIEVTAKLTTAKLQSKVGILIDFGIIVDQQTIDSFPLGIINSHFSLLPEWRGADPITFSLLSGQPFTGVSLMKLVPAMDEGPLLAFGVQEDITRLTTPELTNKLIYLSDGLLQREIPRYLNGATLVDQMKIHQTISDFDYPNQATFSRKLSKADSNLDFNKPAIELEREIRAFADWPKSRTTIAGKDVVVTKSSVVNDIDQMQHNIGEIFTQDKKLLAKTGDGLLAIERLKPAGKSEMTAEAFLAGHGSRL